MRSFIRYFSLIIFFILFYPGEDAAFPKDTGHVHHGNNKKPANHINRNAFYKAMEENNKALVNDQLEELKSAPNELREAFTGAMLMKRASFIGSAASRLHYFREGHKRLESAIQQYPGNVEFRFLRLMIQEHIPGALGYKKDIDNDCGLIRKYYRYLPVEVQLVIEDYSKKSKFLKLDVS